LWRPFSLIWSV